MQIPPIKWSKKQSHSWRVHRLYVPSITRCCPTA